MPISFYWYDEAHTLMIFEFDGPWTVQEFATLNIEAMRAMDTADSPIDFIVDMRTAPVCPAGSLLQYGRILVQNQHPSARFTVIVGANGFIKQVSNALERIYWRHAFTVLFVDTLEEAAELLVSLGSSAVFAARAPVAAK